MTVRAVSGDLLGSPARSVTGSQIIRFALLHSFGMSPTPGESPTRETPRRRRTSPAGEKSLRLVVRFHSLPLAEASEAGEGGGTVSPRIAIARYRCDANFFAARNRQPIFIAYLLRRIYVSAFHARP